MGPIAEGELKRATSVVPRARRAALRQRRTLKQIQLKQTRQRPKQVTPYLSRYYTESNKHPFDTLTWERRDSVVTDESGNTVRELKNIKVPAGWSQLATDILALKYIRKAGVPRTGHETGVDKVVYRIAHTLRKAGEQLGGYFSSKAEADTFEGELTHLLVNQMGAFNSPVWFNVGLFHEYGITNAGGTWYWHPKTDEILQTQNAYAHPQCSACFIQTVHDDLMGIFDLVKSEALLFKYGSGTGSNFSPLRSRYEKLSGGGTSSGLISFLEVLDRVAGATKSGGTTRRAAKMVIVDVDHPEIMDFIHWKVREERKARILIEAGDYPADFNGEAYKTVSGQNANNSVRVTDEFMRAVENDGEWQTKFRTTGEVHQTYKAREIMRAIAEAAWQTADPGMQYDTIVNAWHTCANTDRIYASNPCSEYMFLNDSACNLASLNLVKYLGDDGSFDVEGYRHAVRVFTTAMEIAVDFTSYPTEAIARNSHLFRPLGLGYANLGTLLMLQGIPYDSERGRAWAAALTAILHNHANATSAYLAERKGPFIGYAKNKQPFLRVMHKHRDATYEISKQEAPDYLVAAARQDADQMLRLGKTYGFRNAQATVIAPTGTIGLIMDCDTTGVEPDFALVKMKKLAGGGFFKIVNQSVPWALKNLGYGQEQIDEMVPYALGTLTLEGAPHVNPVTLKEKGLTDEDIMRVQAALKLVFELPMAFASGILGEEARARLKIDNSTWQSPTFNLLRNLGFTQPQIDEASDHICGRMTLEDAPHIKTEDLAVFDCANKCGKYSTRFIAPMGHVKMMAAVQPFISGAISKTVNLPNDATVEEIEKIYLEGWKLGLKAIALYRDGSKLSQPLNISKKSEEEKEVVKVEYRPVRHKLPDERAAINHKFEIAGHEGYITVGLYENGQPGEIFIHMSKEGSTLSGIMDALAISVSVGLQYGVPLKALVNKFIHARFEPAGFTKNPQIRIAKSIVDYIFRWLALKFMPAEERGSVGLNGERGDNGINGSASLQMTMPAPASPVTAPPPAAVEEDEKPAPLRDSTVMAAQQSSQKQERLAFSFNNDLDAPACSECGSIMVRNGTCYKCLNCGSTSGCS